MAHLDLNRNKKRNLKGQFSKNVPKNNFYVDSNENKITNDNRDLQNDHCYFDDFAIGSSVNVPSLASIDNSVSDASWKVGRRVIELDTLAESLSGCSSCQVPINLLNTVGSRDFGLACVLDILCCNCGAINNVATGRKHGRVYDMNTKLALAMVHAGVGVRQINSILSTLNIPAVNHTMLIRRQNEAGQAVEEVAKSSADTFLREEVHLNEMPNNEIDVSVDAGWQKRGSGRAYDSLSGHCSMVSTKTGKVLAYAVRSKTCRVCSQHKKKGNDPCKLHDCRKNWSGSAKAMEPDMVTEMIIETAKKGVKVTGIVGDDDTTTAARLKTNVPHMVEKRSDKNHVKKNLANCLYGMQKNFPTLSTKIINYLLKLFNYNISQNKQNPVGISRGMDAVVGHVFGDHSFCDDTCVAPCYPFLWKNV
ncbi:uncharacterized protein LOC127831382 isoform X2 [Dreissena polymorpha]|uniref:uncharacterized protein LOC127831382 isoform X2 n=1 Tax=Dreissena polymorpha TaxID=45954 RepID=UPI0022643F85|nr:uncharacterized protein LOC127831382 isoform X2 [Dreissena polymorpha]